MHISDEVYRKACLAYCQYDYASAAELFSHCLKINPNDIDVLYRRSLAHAKLNSDSAALADALVALPELADASIRDRDRFNAFGADVLIDLCTRVMQSQPDKTTAVCLALANILGYAEKQEVEKINNAIATLNELLSRYPQDAKAYYFRGLCLDLIKKPAEAERDYIKAAEFDSQHRPSRMHLAQCAMRRNDFKGSTQRYSEVLRLSDKDRAAYHGRAEAFIKCQEFAAAQYDLDKALQLGQASHAVHYLRGVVLWKQGKLEAAASCFVLAEDLMLRNSTGLDSKQSIWLLRDEAKFVFCEMIEKFPTDENGYLGRGLSYYFSGQPTRSESDLKKADEDYGKAMQLNPNCARAYYLRALNHWIFSPDEARKDLDKSLSLDPNNLQALMLKARMRGGTSQDLAAVLERADGDSDVLDEALIHAMLMARDNAAKIDFCTRRIELKLGGHREFGLRGTAYMAGGNHASAIEDFTFALALNPHNIDWMLKRAEAYQALGKEDEAARDATEVINITQDPDIKRRAYLLF